MFQLINRIRNQTQKDQDNLEKHRLEYLETGIKVTQSVKQ